MLAELVKTLVALGKDNAEAKIVPVPGDARGGYLVHGGQCNYETFPAPLRKFRVESLVDLCAMAGDGSVVCGEDRPQIFHDDGAVCLVIHAYDRREIVTLPLRKSERFRTLEGMAGTPWSGTPAQTVQLLRFKLQGVGCDALIAALRKVDFARTNKTSADVTHGRETLGRSVEAAVQSVDTIPETFAVDVPVFTNNGLRDQVFRVRCGIHIDPHEGTIRIAPLADEIANALTSAQFAIIEACKALAPKVPRFWGSPNLS